jgi:hypothetical protein
MWQGDVKMKCRPLTAIQILSIFQTAFPSGAHKPDAQTFDHPEKVIRSYFKELKFDSYIFNDLPGKKPDRFTLTNEAIII